VVTGQLLRTLGIRAHLGGDSAFTYGLLHARQHDTADHELRYLHRAARRARRPKVRSWLG
jgi:hypothetical protein